MLADLENLIQLQQADREIQRLEDEVAALPRRVAAIEEKLADTRAAVEKARATIKADEAEFGVSSRARSRTTSRKYPSTATNLWT